MSEFCGSSSKLSRWYMLYAFLINLFQLSNEWRRLKPSRSLEQGSCTWSEFWRLILLKIQKYLYNIWVIFITYLVSSASFYGQCDSYWHFGNVSFSSWKDLLSLPNVPLLLNLFSFKIFNNCIYLYIYIVPTPLFSILTFPLAESCLSS